MSHLLALDTSGNRLGLALLAPGREPVTIDRDAPRRHVESIAPAVRDLFAKVGSTPAHLDVVLVAAGPGSFTGLRIGMASAKGIALGSGASVVSVDTLEAIATQTVVEREHADNGRAILLALIDARKGRMYASCFQAAAPNAVTEIGAGLLRLTANEDTLPETALDTAMSLAAQHSTSVLVCGPAADLVPTPSASPVQVTRHNMNDRSAVLGVLCVGRRLYQSGLRDGPTQGPAYVRSGDIGRPRRTSSS